MPVLERVKQVYLLWHSYHSTLPKLHRYTLGGTIDALFVEAIEAAAAAAYLPREEKRPYVRRAIEKIDASKVLLMVLWESRSLDTKKYAALSEKLGEVGKMLGGWQSQLAKQNSPAEKAEEK